MASASSAVHPFISHVASRRRRISSLPNRFSSRDLNHYFHYLKASNAEQVQEPASTSTSSTSPQVQTGTWSWRGYKIRYQYTGTSGPALVLIHGFGANRLTTGEKIYPFLQALIEYMPSTLLDTGIQINPTHKRLAVAFTHLNMGGSTQHLLFRRGLVGLQAAVTDPSICKGVVLLDISLRMLHIKKQPWYGKPFIKSFQSLLRNTPVEKLFFNSVATPDSVKSILCQCYHDTSAVTDELVQVILQPGLDPGAADVFLEFICYWMDLYQRSFSQK